jgi:hypothetical protein
MITGVIVCFWGILTGYNNDDKQDDYQHRYCHPESITDTYNRNLRPIYPVPSPGTPPYLRPPCPCQGRYTPYLIPTDMSIKNSGKILCDIIDLPIININIITRMKSAIYNNNILGEELSSH